MDKIKIGDFLSKVAVNVADTATQVVDSVKERQQEKEKLEQERQAVESGKYEKDGKVIVTSMDGLRTWLAEVQSEAAPSLMEIIQTQLQTLQSINSPILQGMVLDSLLQSLYQSLENEKDETARKNIRNMYAGIIQNMFFFNEAKICYAVQKNKDAALALIGQAADQLSSNIMKISKMLEGSAPVQISNIFANDSAQTSFISKVCSWVSDRKAVQKAIGDYRKSLENLFESFDRYSALLGPSILIQGMLAKYRVELVGMKQQDMLRPILDKVKSQKNGMLIKNLGNILLETSSSVSNVILSINKPAALASAGVTLAGSVASSIGSYMADSEIEDVGDVETLMSLIRYREECIAQLEQKAQALNDEIMQMESRKSELGLFKASEKKELLQKIQQKENEIKSLSEEITAAKNNLEAFDEYVPKIQAIIKEVQEYETTLKRIEDEFTLSGCEGDLLKR